MQKWKEDSKLHSCARQNKGSQQIKTIDYEQVYKREFLESDPVKDWESIDRCKELWLWAIEKIDANPTDWKVLDVGTKDAQFPEWLMKNYVVEQAIGCEIADDYLKYAEEKGRPIVYANACDMPKRMHKKFDIVFSHHLLGLVPDYLLGLNEMWKCVKHGGYMLTLNDIPGNPLKHYSLIESPQIFMDFMGQDNVVQSYPILMFNDFWYDKFPKEWVFFIQKGLELPEEPRKKRMRA